MPFPATHPALSRALEARDYHEPTPVQRAVLEAQAEGRDLLVSAQTGSGKTVAFGLAFADTLLGEGERFGEPSAPLALVVAPTRELALQVNRELGWLYAEAGARIVTCVGGMNPRQEARALDRGAHIVVGTPGRLRDHLERAQLDPSALRVVVLDEADEMLDLGFREDLEFILESTPPERRTLLFSATIDPQIAGLARNYQRDALRIDTLERNVPHADIEYRALRVAPNEVELGVVNVLRFYDAGAALVFCSTRDAVRHLHASLVERGFAAVALSGEMGQNERNGALQSLRDGRTRICVATDVAARGLDLPRLDLVVHADLPNNRETLLHRSGRTGRAGRKGTCVLMVPYTRGRRAGQLIASAGVTAEWGNPPSAEDIRNRDRERLMADPVFAEAAEGEDESLVHSLLDGRTPEQLARAVARLYRARLPEPEELFEGGPQRDERPRRPREEREPREPRERRRHADLGPQGETEWFRINVGRQKNADPKWLLPMLCRVGHVTRREIGVIKVMDRETKFEVSREVADRFRAAVESSAEQEFSIHPAAAPAARERRPDREGPLRRPHGRDEGNAPEEPGRRPPRGERRPYAGKPQDRQDVPRESEPAATERPEPARQRPEGADDPSRSFRKKSKPADRFGKKPGKPKAARAGKGVRAARPGDQPLRRKPRSSH
ncbi:MAG: DEAD/DEAH box helicase [Alphaproteobacteria bacterium]|nr:DEAD/DEAH box helicase [Alphaproteobacteria bacterium]